jgi:phosphorylase/glycogen(starch) synthase
VCDEISAIVEMFSGLSGEDLRKARNQAFDISRIVLWPNLIKHYKSAYHIALEQVSGRVQFFVETERVEQMPEIDEYPGRIPAWKKVTIQQNIPQKLKPLEELSRNLWWSWNPLAIELFSQMDENLWNESLGNPIDLLMRY